MRRRTTAWMAPSRHTPGRTSQFQKCRQPEGRSGNGTYASPLAYPAILVAADTDAVACAVSRRTHFSSDIKRLLEHNYGAMLPCICHLIVCQRNW